MVKNNTLKIDIETFNLLSLTYRRKAKVQEAHGLSVAVKRVLNALCRKTTAAVDEGAGLDVTAAIEQTVFPVSALKFPNFFLPKASVLRNGQQESEIAMRICKTATNSHCFAKNGLDFALPLFRNSNLLRIRFAV